jgi:hypothetical protein
MMYALCLSESSRMVKPLKLAMNRKTIGKRISAT